MTLKTTLIAATAALGLSLCAAGAASAQSGAIPSGGVTVEEMVRFLQNKGFKAEVKTGTSGRYIASAASGVNFDVYFYDCRGSRCASVQFSAGFDLTNGTTLSVVNNWNREKRYLKAYMDSENDPYVQYDANTSPARTWEGLADDFGVWTSTLPMFTRHINW